MSQIFRVFLNFPKFNNRFLIRFVLLNVNLYISFVLNYIQCTKLTLKNMDWCQKNWSNFPNVNDENLNVKFLWSNLKGYLLTFWSMILKKIWCWELGAPRPTSLGPRPEFTYSKMNDSEIKGQCHRPSTLFNGGLNLYSCIQFTYV